MLVISHNLHRRHLTTSQRSDVAAKIATMRSGTRTDLGSNDPRSIDDAAKQMKVSPASVKRAKKVHAKGSEAVKQAVEQGATMESYGCGAGFLQSDESELMDETDPVAWVISHNLHRRHLTTGQRADVAAKVATMRHGDVKSQKSDGSKDPSSITDAAKLMKVSPASVKRAKKVHNKGSEAVKQAVEQGELTVSVAAEFIKAVPDKAEQQCKEYALIARYVGSVRFRTYLLVGLLAMQLLADEDQTIKPRNPRSWNRIGRKGKESVDSVNRLKGGNDTDYTLRRLARDKPELLDTPSHRSAGLFRNEQATIVAAWSSRRETVSVTVSIKVSS